MSKTNINQQVPHPIPLDAPMFRDVPKPTAALLAASYTSYDKAGRELGVDATKLAQTVDLAGLIKIAQNVANQGFVGGCSPQSMLRGIHDMQDRLRAVLAKLPRD